MGLNMSTAHISIGTSSDGKACGTGDYEVGSCATLAATPDSGCRFVQWDDGISLNPRTVVVTGNETYKAQFASDAPAANVIRYNAATAATGDWVTNHTDTSLNTYDSVTGNGVLYLNSGVTSIGGGNSTTYTPFYQKSDLVSVELGSQITSIYSYAFYYCTSLTSVTIPSGVTRIGGEAFSHCTALPSIIIPSGVTSIWLGAFELCSNLTSITIGSGVTSIGVSAFANCSNLTSVTCLAATPPTLGSDNFIYSDNNTLYVPAASLSAYQSDTTWSSKFTTITAIV